MKRQTLYQGKYKRFMLEQGWEFIETIGCGGIVAILALTEDRKVLFVEQMRVPVGGRVIEIPAGLACDKKGHEQESLAEAAERELLEETGYRAKKVSFLFHGPVAAASNVDIITFFKAEGLKKIGAGGGDETESILVHEIALEKVDFWLCEKQENGFLVDPKVYAGLYFLKCKR